MKPRPELLSLAEESGARLTGKPDGSEPITVVFTIEAWRAFDVALVVPIDMVLHCPVCHTQHIDAPDDPSTFPGDENLPARTNPPHKSHLCHGCGHIWRPADVPTNGVADTKTRGKNDSPKGTP